MPHLQSFQVKNRDRMPEKDFPYHLPFVKKMESMDFPSPVTFFVGENGTGKSTLLESIAEAANAIAVVSEEPHETETLADHLKLIWTIKTRKGFFLRADDFINYVKRLSRTKVEMEQELERVETEYKNRSVFARNLARLPFNRSLHELKQLYGEGLDVKSHGESFLEFFGSRIRSGGLYLLDEPEAPLSPLKQLTFLSILKESVTQDCQFIIATHSPITMAFPGATIYSFDHNPIQKTEYEDLEHVKITKSFLEHPEHYLRHL